MGKLIQPGTFAFGSFMRFATSAIVFPESMRMKTTWCASFPAFESFTVVTPAGIVSGAAKLKSLAVMVTTFTAGGAGGGAGFRLQPSIATLTTASAAVVRAFMTTILGGVGEGNLRPFAPPAIRLADPPDPCYASRARTHHTPGGGRHAASAVSPLAGWVIDFRRPHRASVHPCRGSGAGDDRHHSRRRGRPERRAGQRSAGAAARDTDQLPAHRHVGRGRQLRRDAPAARHL